LGSIHLALHHFTMGKLDDRWVKLITIDFTLWVK